MDIISYQNFHKDAVIRMLGNANYKIPLWEWQFSNEKSNLLTPSVVAVIQGDVIGFNGLMPIEINHSGIQSSGLWSCDFIVDDRYRNQGVGMALKQYLANLKPPKMSLGISDNAVTVLVRSGWAPTTKINIFNIVNSPRRYKDWLIIFMQSIRKVRHLFSVDLSSVEKRDCIPEREQIDSLWRQVKGEYAHCVVRNYDYLQWRYALMPSARYQYLTLGQKNLKALAVIRISNTTSYFVDYLGPVDNLIIKTMLFNKWLELSNTIQQLHLTTSDPQFSQLARHYGARITGQLRFYTQGVILDQDDWYIMTGDSDGEFLKAASATTNLE